MDPRPPGGVRFIGGLMKLNAIVTGLIGILFVAKSSDDAFWARLDVPSGIGGYQGLAFLLVAGLTWILVLALYDRSRGARVIVTVLTCLRIAADLASIIRYSGPARAVAIIDLLFGLFILFLLYGTPAATEWFKRQEYPESPVPPRPV